jgi:hypothetical protein
MDHEAYSSKSLRSLSLASMASANSNSKSDELKPERIVHEEQQPEMPHPISKPTEPSSESANFTELDMYEEMYDKEVQTTLPITTEADATEQASSSLSLSSDRDATDKVEKIVSDAVGGIATNLDSHIDTLADFLHNTSKVLRVIAEKTRESDTSAVESILSGFNTIFGEVGKLALAVLDTAEATPATDPVELDLQQIHETSCDKGKEKEVASPEPKQNELSASVEVVSDTVNLPSPMLNSSPRPIVRVETLPAQPVKISPLHHRATELTARLPASQLDKLYHVPSTSFPDNRPQEVPAEKDQMFSTLERGGFNSDSNRTWKYMPLPSDDQMSKTKKKVDFAVPSATLRPRETAKSSSETFPRSILDLETSDPDFSARFPPLMTVRRSKTLDSLRQRSKSPENKTRSRQDALKRFPSLVQLERRKVVDDYLREANEDNARNTMQPEEPPVSHVHRAWFDDIGVKGADSVNTEFKRQSDEIEEVIAAVGRDIVEASNEVRRLPGAWPEVQVDSKTTLPTSSESSGAFFNRMTAHATFPERRQPTPFEEPLATKWPTSGYQYGRARPHSNNLERAKSMASFHPSATLTTPFDPLMSSTMATHSVGTGEFPRARPSLPPTEADMHAEFEALLNGKDDLASKLSSNSAQDLYNLPKQRKEQSTTSKVDGVHRSATERMPHRRPYSHRYSGAGRLPWENFEDHSYDLRTGSFVQRQERARRAADRPIPQPSATYDAAPKYWRTSESSSRRPVPAPAARQNPAHPIKLPSDLHKRVSDYRAGLRHRASMPAIGVDKRSQIKECIRQLRDMGFGNEDVNEANRLSVYAEATGGDIFEAVEMIEEDRKAGNFLMGRGQTVRPL